ncbi:MAG: esterase family protein [Chitinophagaceae bacterium]|nr:esterase family protein [Chitinophagaceae bacterium]
MNKAILTFLLISIALTPSFGQTPKGIVIHEKFLAASIIGNPGGEDAIRRVTIYLPPNYYKSKQHYPVIYFLHGFNGEDSATMDALEINKLLDTAISSKHIRPVIFVLPNSFTKYRGSFYTNSVLTGRWTDYIAKDVVNYIDKRFRTIPNKDSRGISGASMGGNGALKLGMLFPDVFSSVYATTPATLNWSDGINTNIEAFKKLSEIKNDSELLKTDRPLLMVDLARTYSPNLNKPPFYADMPAYYIGDSLVIDTTAVNKWTANFATNMIESHLTALKSLKAIKIDWGRNDAGRHVPVTCLQFSKKLEWYGVHHFAEEYLGGHAEHLEGTDGRLYTEILPFFDTYLNFKE